MGPRHNRAQVQLALTTARLNSLINKPRQPLSPRPPRAPACAHAHDIGSASRAHTRGASLSLSLSLSLLPPAEEEAKSILPARRERTAADVRLYRSIAAQPRKQAPRAESVQCVCIYMRERGRAPVTVQTSIHRRAAGWLARSLLLQQRRKRERASELYTRRRRRLLSLPLSRL